MKKVFMVLSLLNARLILCNVVTVVALSLQISAGAWAQTAGEPITIVPKPSSLRTQSGTTQLTASSRIIYATRTAPRSIENSLQPLANVLSNEIELVTGLNLAVVSSANALPGPGDIALEFAPISGGFAETEAEENQAYDMTVADTITIQSQYYKGVAYGTASLLQALVDDGGSFSVQRMQINDQPAAPYRALMVDIARQRHTPASLKEVIQFMRLYKTRYLHLHVTDDQNFVFPFGPITDNISNNYTISRSDFVDLVNYADARGVTIIPELDLPGHSTKLLQSGYLNAPSNTHADVAASRNYSKIHAIIDDMMSVFASAPYFHIGGDESQAGSALIPFLSDMNRHIRSLGRRMMVWEGFQGSPTDMIPATGPDRVIVMSWESSYNAPWDLLQSGYTLINASWKPLYVVGLGTPLHPGNSGRQWSGETIYGWDAETFMHWEPGRPVYQDVGPNDPNRQDSVWKASYIGRQDQVIGGQLLFWEGTDQYTVEELRERLPALAERLWNPSAGTYQQHAARRQAVQSRVMTITRPIEVLPATEDPTSQLNFVYRIYDGDAVQVSLVNRSRISGVIRYETDDFDGRFDWIIAGRVQDVTENSPVYTAPFSVPGSFGIRAQLYRDDGTPVPGTSWEVFNNWKQRVMVTDYRRGRDEFPLSESVPDLSQFGADRLIRQTLMPTLRGPAPHNQRKFQRLDATLRIANGGGYTLSAKTQSGRATVYVDLNRNGVWDSNEAVIRDTPTSEAWVDTGVTLSPGDYKIRVDHNTDLPRPVVVVALNGPDTGNRREDISSRLVPLESSPPPPPLNANLALGKPASTSSLEGAADRSGAQAVDGNLSSRWASQYSDPQWIQIDLGDRYDINRVVLSWETAFGNAYDVQVSDDASNWRSIFSTTTGDGGIDDLTGLSGQGRYIRMYGTRRGTQWGYSLWEMEVYGTEATDPTPMLRIADVRVNEGAGSVSLSVNLDVASADAVTVDVATTTQGSATANEDFTPIAETISIPAGATSIDVTIPIINDTLAEPNETVVVRLSNPNGAELADDNATLTIVDDDNGNGNNSGTPVVSVVPTQATESAGQVDVLVELSSSSTSVVRVNLATRDDSAAQGSDYYGLFRQLEFAPGETAKRVPVTILNDFAEEVQEQFIVRLFSVEGATMGTPEATVTIVDDDDPSFARLTILPVSVSENVGEAEIVVSLSTAVNDVVRVNAATRPGTAMQGVDYYGFFQQLEFAPGQTEQRISMTVLDDNVPEDGETIFVRLFSSQGAQIGEQGEATVTIEANDSTSPPGSDPGEMGTMVNVKSGLCLTVVGGQSNVGADIVQSTCTDVDHQKFTLSPTPDGYGRVQAFHSQGCLVVRAASGEPGQPIEQNNCAGGANHEWAAVDSWDNRDQIQFKAHSTGMCLTVKDGSTSDGAIVVQEPCRRRDSSQVWTTVIADEVIGRSGPNSPPSEPSTYHGVQGFHSFGDGVIQQDAWTRGDIAYYAAQGQVSQSVADQWISWYVRVDELYRQISARPNFDSVFRRNDPNFGPKKVIAVIDNDRHSCGSVNAAGCGSKQQAQAAQDYLPRMLREPDDYYEHWVLFYEMGRGGSPESFYGRATWPANTVIFPHTMAGIAFHELGGDAGMERGIPGLLLNDLVAWEQSGREFVVEYADRQSHDLLAAMLYRILQDHDVATIAQIMRNMEQKPAATSAVQAMCDFQDAVNSAVSGYAERMKGPWGLPDSC